jgi:death-on-curing protein
MLESAASRPFSSAGGKDAFPETFDKAAALFHGIISNHSFYNGNKRTALLSVLYFLGDEGFIVDKCTDNEMFEFTRQVAAHEITNERIDELEFIKEWFLRNSRKQLKGDCRLTFKELRIILIHFGFDISDHGNTYQITHDKRYITNIKKKGSSGHEEYDKKYISELRKRLSLTANYGVDSPMFYMNKGVSDDLSKLMEMRSEVMRELAKI